MGKALHGVRGLGKMVVLGVRCSRQPLKNRRVPIDPGSQSCWAGRSSALSTIIWGLVPLTHLHDIDHPKSRSFLALQRLALEHRATQHERRRIPMARFQGVRCRCSRKPATPLEEARGRDVGEMMN